jgi:hypothetical protein
MSNTTLKHSADTGNVEAVIFYSFEDLYLILNCISIHLIEIYSKINNAIEKFIFCFPRLAISVQRSFFTETFIASFNNGTALITKTGCNGINSELGHPQFGIYSLLLAIQIVQ